MSKLNLKKFLNFTTYHIIILTYKAILQMYQDWNLFAKTEMNNEWNVNFLQNTPLHHTYSNESHIGQSTSEISLLVRYEATPLYLF